MPMPTKGFFLFFSYMENQKPESHPQDADLQRGCCLIPQSGQRHKELSYQRI